MTNFHKNLSNLRKFMLKTGIDYYIATPYDEYLNEYSALNDNSRYLITGFSGSTGPCLVTKDRVFLFVDGRYHIQAEQQTDRNYITVVKTKLGKSPSVDLIEKLLKISKKGSKIALCSSKTGYSYLKRLSQMLAVKKPEFIELEADIISKIAKIKPVSEKNSLRQISTAIIGTSPLQKFAELLQRFQNLNINSLLISKLDEIAYLTNLRGNEIPYSSAFRAKALIYEDKCHIFMNLENLPKDLSLDNNFVFHPKKEFEKFLTKIKSKQDLTVGVDKIYTNLADIRLLQKYSFTLQELEISPTAEMKSVKNEAELNYIKDCFLKTDIAVSRAIIFLNNAVSEGKKISEKDFSQKVKACLIEEEAIGLSFEPICASGKNTAIVHYTTPDENKIIKTGDLVLLDCGAYYQGGYATDITRTFIAGGEEAKASAKAKRLYTTVLKAFLKGMNHKIKPNTSGFHIDKKVREVFKRNELNGFEFSHGTGHGIGLLVHEDPPRLGTSKESKKPFKEGMCFSIEPGLYNKNYGGVRIENGVCLEREEGELKIKSLTMYKLDENLIDYNYLSAREKNQLRAYQENAVN